MFCAEFFVKRQKVYKFCALIIICTKNSPKNTPSGGQNGPLSAENYPCGVIIRLRRALFHRKNCIFA